MLVPVGLFFLFAFALTFGQQINKKSAVVPPSADRSNKQNEKPEQKGSTAPSQEAKDCHNNTDNL